MFNMPTSTFVVFFIAMPALAIVWLVWWAVTFK